MSDKKTDILLRKVPDDVKDKIFKVQGDIKLSTKRGKVSMGEAVYKMIRAYKKDG